MIKGQRIRVIKDVHHLGHNVFGEVGEIKRIANYYFVKLDTHPDEIKFFRDQIELVHPNDPLADITQEEIDALLDCFNNDPIDWLGNIP